MKCICGKEMLRCVETLAWVCYCEEEEYDATA